MIFLCFYIVNSLPAFSIKSILAIFHVFRLQKCQHKLQKCWAGQGQITKTEGNKTDDTRCTCLSDQGYFPTPADPQCTSQDGFPAASGCKCVYHFHKSPAYYRK